MLPLIPILLLLITAAILAILAWQRPKFRHQWLVSVGGAGLAWASMLILRIRMPHSMTLLAWKEQGGVFNESPALLVDEISWSFGLALVTLTLAIMLTEVWRAADGNWRSWASILAVAGLGILAVFSSNFITLILTWLLIDVLELVVILTQVSNAKIQRGAVLYLSTSLLGTLLVIWVSAAARIGGDLLTFSNIPSNLSLWLLIAVGLRLGVLPLQVNILPGDHFQRGLGSIIRLVPPAASLVLLTRIAHVPIPENLKPYILILIAVAALYGALAWLGSVDELSGGVFWILAAAALAFVGAVQSQPAAVLGWSLAMIYAGGMLFLASLRQRKYFLIGILAIFNLTALPLSPTFLTGSVYTADFTLTLILVLIAQAILFVGFIRHVRRETLTQSGFEPWVHFVYLVGFSLLPVIHFAALNWLIPTSGTIIIAGGSDLSFPLLTLIIALFTGILLWRGIKPSTGILSTLEAFFSLEWIYQIGGYALGYVGRGVIIISKLIEGPGGILWALLILVILISILFQIETGIGG